MGDHLDSTSVGFDAETAELVERGTYQAYGAADSDYRPARWASFREDHRFTGKEEDVEVGITYFGARYYSAQLGRWMSADPLTVHAAGSDLNPYAYVRGRTFNAVDPFGLDGCGAEHTCSPEGPVAGDAGGWAKAGSAVWNGTEKAGRAVGDVASSFGSWVSGLFKRGSYRGGAPPVYHSVSDGLGLYGSMINPMALLTSAADDVVATGWEVATKPGATYTMKGHAVGVARSAISLMFPSWGMETHPMAQSLTAALPQVAANDVGPRGGEVVFKHFTSALLAAYGGGAGRVGEAVAASWGEAELAAARTVEGLSAVAKGAGGAAEVAATEGGAGLADSALVCRGGTCTAGRFATGSGVTLDGAGRLQGVSVNSGHGASLEELTASIPNKQVGVTTVGQVRAMGGDVIPSPRPNNPFHCTLCGITPNQAEMLFTPTIQNPTLFRF